MPNGFQGPKEEWDRMEAPLLKLDDAIRRFADDIGATVERNYHGVPGRSIDWEDSISRSIQIYIEDEAELTYDLWISASQDRKQSRYWKHEFLFRDRKLDEFSDCLEDYLKKGFELVSAWRESDLQYAVDLSTGSNRHGGNSGHSST